MANNDHEGCTTLFQGEEGRVIFRARNHGSVHHAGQTRRPLRGGIPCSLARQGLIVEQMGLSDYERMAELVEQYADFPLGAADAAVVGVAERIPSTFSVRQKVRLSTVGDHQSRQVGEGEH